MKALNIICLIFIGVCLGLLTGLSVSPVIQSILSSFIALITSIFVVLIGLKNSNIKTIVESVDINSQSLTLLPFAIFLLCFTVGSFAGIYTRSNDLLGQDLEKVVKKWTDLKIERDTVINDLYNQSFNKENINLTYFEVSDTNITRTDSHQIVHQVIIKQNPPAKNSESENVTKKTSTLLFKYELPSNFEGIYGQQGRDLKNALSSYNNPAIDSFLVVTKDSLSLEALKTFLITLTRSKSD